MKKKKKRKQKNWCRILEFGYCPNCIAIQQIVLQGCVVGWEENCIAIQDIVL